MSCTRVTGPVRKTWKWTVPAPPYPLTDVVRGENLSGRGRLDAISNVSALMRDSRGVTVILNDHGGGWGATSVWVRTVKSVGLG